MNPALRLPFWLKIGFAIIVLVIVPVYWVEYGPQNFLWLSDIALFCVTLSLWTGWALPASAAAVGVLPLEILWVADFISGGKIGLALYMFDATLPLWLRALSLFHLALPPTLIFLLVRLGYDRRALWVQIAITWAALLAAYAVSTPQENIDWVFGWGDQPQQVMAPAVYFALEMAVIPLGVIVPMHLLLRRLLSPPVGDAFRNKPADLRRPTTGTRSAASKSEQDHPPTRK